MVATASRSPFYTSRSPQSSQSPQSREAHREDCEDREDHYVRPLRPLRPLSPLRPSATAKPPHFATKPALFTRNLYGRTQKKARFELGSKSRANVNRLEGVYLHNRIGYFVYKRGRRFPLRRSRVLLRVGVVVSIFCDTPIFGRPVC